MTITENTVDQASDSTCDYTPDFTKVAVETLVPHSPPMVLLDEVLAYDDNSLRAAVTLHAGSMFYDSALNGVPAWAGIEYMAQAISAFAGIQSLKRGEAVQLGFLLGTRKLSLHRTVLPVDRPIEIQVQELIRDSTGLASFACSITIDNVRCADARVNVFEAAGLPQVTRKA